MLAGIILFILLVLYFVYSYRADKALEDLIIHMVDDITRLNYISKDIARLDAEVKRLDSVVSALVDVECPEFRGGDRG